MRFAPLAAVAVAAPILMTGFAAAPASAAVTPTNVSASVAAKKATPKKSKKTQAMGAVAMRTKNTTYTPTQAANRLQNWADNGMSGYHNRCLQLADNAYQPNGGRTSTALSQWHRAKSKGYAHPGDSNPPVGAQMFWKTSNPAGHIATYVGDGKAVTNMPGGKVKEINWKNMNDWGPYLGWAEPYYS